MKSYYFFMCVYFVSCIGVAATFDSIKSGQLQDAQALPQNIKMTQYENIVFKTFVDASHTKTLQRRGVIVRRNNPIGTVLICHGYLGSKEEALKFDHLFPSYNVMVFDFRAHGDDRAGQVSTIGRDEAFDVIGAVDVIKHDPQMHNKPIIAFGYSMGAVASIQAQAIDPTLFDAMILDCPYDSTDAAMRRGLDEKMKFSLFGRQYTLPGKEFIIRHMYDRFAQMMTNILFQSITQLDCNKVKTKFVRVAPVESIAHITVPCLFIYCKADKKVPVEAIQALYEKKPGFKRMWLTQGRRHFGSYSHDPEMYAYKVNKFLTKLHEHDISTRDQERVCDQRSDSMMHSAYLVSA